MPWIEGGKLIGIQVMLNIFNNTVIPCMGIFHIYYLSWSNRVGKEVVKSSGRCGDFWKAAEVWEDL